MKPTLRTECIVAAVMATAILAGCAGATYRPLVDRPGENYEQDLRECQRHAEGEMGASGGAAAGALLGALLGAVLGHKSGVQGEFVRSGVVGGMVGGAIRGESDQHEVIKRCMSGRGYNVLR